MSFYVDSEIALLRLCMVTEHLLCAGCMMGAPGLLHHSGSQVMRTGALSCPGLRVPVRWGLRQYGAGETGMDPK